MKNREYPQDYSDDVLQKIKEANKIKNNDYVYNFLNGKCNKNKKVLIGTINNKIINIKISRISDFATNFEILLLKNGKKIYKNKLEKFLENKCTRCNTICQGCKNSNGISEINNIYMLDLFTTIFYGEILLKQFDIFPKDFIIPLTMLPFKEVNILFQIKNDTKNIEYNDIQMIMTYDEVFVDDDYRNELAFNYYNLGNVCPKNYGNDDNVGNDNKYIYLGNILFYRDLQARMPNSRKN